MSHSVRLSLIHATRHAIDPTEAAFRDAWPEAQTLSLLEEGLSIDRARNAELTPELAARIVSLARYAEGIGAAGILYTCSAFGAAIEEASRTSPVPVLKPNEAMFEEAFRHGSRVAMIYTFPPALAGMEQEFREEAARRNSHAQLETTLANGARGALEAGDEACHNRGIAEAAAHVRDADVILLAHFSMARAVGACREVTSLPVLASPETAVQKLKALLTAERQTS